MGSTWVLQLSHMSVRLISLSKFLLGVIVCMLGCLPLCASVLLGDWSAHEYHVGIVDGQMFEWINGIL